MYIQCEERELCMYNICSTNYFVRVLMTYGFSLSNSYHDHSISEYKVFFLKKNRF